MEGTGKCGHWLWDSPRQKLCFHPTWLWPDHAACFYQRAMDQEICPGKGQGQGLWDTLLRCWASRLHHLLWRLAKSLFPSPCQIVGSIEDWLESIACKWEVQLYLLLGWIYKNVKNSEKCEALNPHSFHRSWASLLISTGALDSTTFPKGQCLKSWCVKLSVIYQNAKSCFPFCLSASVNRLLYFSYHFMFKSPKHHNQA